MVDKLVKYIFFSNYFIGLLAIALSIETCCQLQLQLNSIPYYLLLFSATVMYYSYAYQSFDDKHSQINERTEWYSTHPLFARWNVSSAFIACVLLAIFLIKEHYAAMLHLPIAYWLIIMVAIATGLLYYGLVPRSFLRFNLRNTGWVKAFVIGFVWACAVSLLPLVMLKIEHGLHLSNPVFVAWLFVKNWMFCTVNAIMFDMKDFAEDANHQLKTFVVRIGLRKTIYFVLMPLLLIGIASMAVFAYFEHFGIVYYLINLLPFLLLILLAYSMHTRKNILYYLIAIDGVLFIKALCGIVAMKFIN